MPGVFELVILVAILCFVFNSRVYTMVDVLSARMQAFYTNWDEKPKSPLAKKLSANSLRRYGPAERREKFRALSSEDLHQYRDRDLFRTKEIPWSVGISSKNYKPATGLPCKACIPDGKDFVMNPAFKDEPVRNILKTDMERSKFFLTRTFCHMVHIWQFKKFDFPRVNEKVLSSDILKKAIMDVTESEIQNSAESKISHKKTEEKLRDKIVEEQETRAKRILVAMGSTLSDLLLRITTWVLYKLFPRFLKSVCLHPTRLEMIQKAAKTNLPLIFVPLHRSHLDYILITFVLQNIKVKSPIVAAGNNLRIPVFGWLLRGLGAFFIKRRIDPMIGKKDTLYRAVLHTYMTECLRAGYNIEFYIEGGRTRTGKPCMPKGGLLSIIIGAYMDGTVEDALLVPVSVNYDKLVDGNFVSELLGQPKQMETFFSALSAIWATLNSNYGSIRIDFNQPFSLKEIVKSLQNKSSRSSVTDLGSVSETETGSISRKNGYQREKSFRSCPSTTSLYGTDVVDESHRTLVEKIARHLIYDSFKVCAVMSTNAVSFLLLNKYRHGVPFRELVISFDELRKQLTSDNRDVGFSGESEDVVEYAINLLGPDLVRREGKVENDSESVEFIYPVKDLPNVIALSYYSNTVVSHFVMDGIVATAISCSIRFEESSDYTVGIQEVMKKSLDLCDIFQFEFIFAKPCESLEYVINETIEKFVYMDILLAPEIANFEYDEWNRKVANNFDESEDDEFYQYQPYPIYTVNNKKEKEEKLELFHTILRPLVDAYVATAMRLKCLLAKEMPESEFLKDVLEEIKIQLRNGNCSYGESCSVESIKNAMKLLKKWSVIEFYSRDLIRFVSLTDVYNREEDLDSIIGKIGHFKFLGTTPTTN